MSTHARIGFGFDVHRFVEGRPLVLGGVRIPYHLGLEGHSDADVLLHAVMDALLGAAALGDIGRHFPPTDAQYKDASSIELLKRVGSMLREHRFDIINIDSTVVLEQPRLLPYIDMMRTNIAAALSLTPDHISIKATTNERLGFIGTGEGAAAHAVAAVIQREL